MKSQPRQSSTVLLKRMREAVDDGRVSEAASLFDQQRANAPGDAALLRAWMYVKKRDYAQAIKFLNDLSSLTRAQDAERLMILGVAHSRSNRFAEADEY